jgi:2,3-bisphosphoglycerate-independent phosphoglycerate mutase
MSGADHAMSEAIRQAYRRGQEEESMEPLVRVDASGRPEGRIRHGDQVIFYDIRGEREIELTQAFVCPGFGHFPVVEGLRPTFTTLVEYDPELPVEVAFPPLEELSGTLSEVVSRAGRRQVKVTETEKAVHLAYFLNGKRKGALRGESQVTPHSPLDPLAEPEMRAAEVADAVSAALADPTVDLVIGNLPNVDVVGHSEKRDAILRAVEAVDTALGRILAAATSAGVVAVVTADHGTVEEWLYPEGTINTGHTASPVPLAVAFPPGSGADGATLAGGGGLVDVAPTVLELLGLPRPVEMSGRSLLRSAPLAGNRSRVLLLICDGWGVAPPGPGNLIHAAHTPHMDALLAHAPHTVLAASGLAVGLPEGTVGNSEAGHLHIGAGRPVWSDKLRLERALGDGSFLGNRALLAAAERARDERTRLHLLGIVSFFSSHGSIDYLLASLEIAARVGVSEVFVHGLLGRRGERPESGAHYVGLVEDACDRLGVGKVVSVIGRHWALDREHNWDRIERTYNLLVRGVGHPVR